MWGYLGIKRMRNKGKEFGLFIMLLIITVQYMYYHSADKYSNKESIVLESVVNKTFKTMFLNISRDPLFDYKKETEILNKAKVAADEPRLISLIRNYYIEMPSKQSYQLQFPNQRDSSFGQAMFVDGTLQNMESGFFVDVGAHNGETQSNTLFFERIRHWSGILIEPQPQIYKLLKNKQRKAYHLNACVSTVPYPTTVKFFANSFYGAIVNDNESYLRHYEDSKLITVQCFPLYSILLAVNQLKVDYFSLDVEGAEQGILDTLPWKSVDIRVLSIEYDKFAGGAEQLRQYMEKRGYSFLVKMDSVAAHDSIFKKLHN